MIQHMSNCIEHGFVVGYGALIMEILIKSNVQLNGVPTIGMTTGNLFNAKAFNNLNVCGNDGYVVKARANVDDDEEEDEYDGEEDDESEFEVEKEKEKERKWKNEKIDKIEKEKRTRKGK